MRQEEALHAHPAFASQSVVRRAKRGGALRRLRGSAPTGDNPPGIHAGTRKVRRWIRGG